MNPPRKPTPINPVRRTLKAFTWNARGQAHSTRKNKQAKNGKQVTLKSGLKNAHIGVNVSEGIRQHREGLAGRGQTQR